jgi:hypothetical protein
VPEFDQERANLDVSVFAEIEVHHRLPSVAVHQSKRTAHDIGAGLGADPRTKQLALKRSHRALVDAPVDGEVVTLLHEVTRVREPVCEGAIVGEENEPTAVKVQPTNAIEARAARMLDEIDRARSSFGVAVGADRPARLEEHDVDMPLRSSDLSPVHLNSIADGIGPRRQHVDNFSVHGDGTSADEIFTLAPRCNPGVGQNALKANAARFFREFVAGFGRATGLAGLAHRRSVRNGALARLRGDAGCGRLSSLHAHLRV